MRFRLFSPRLGGKTLTLSATQNGRTAGPVTQVRYGTSSDRVAITVDRSSIRCAPDSVRFGVDLSGTEFDTPGPGAGEVYDARLHELVFLWTTGDAGTWEAPENVLPEWNDKGRAKGPWFAHCYTRPGSYTVTLTVMEPSSGKIATGSVTIEVTDPDIAYSGQKTICIDPPGAAAGGWGPPGAVHVQWDRARELINEQSWWGAINIPSDRRFLFDAAAIYPDGIGFLFDGSVNINNPYIGAWGTGRAVLQASTSAALTGKMIYVTSDFDGFLESGPRDFRIDRIDGRGTFDPTMEVTDDLSASGKASSFLRTNKYLDLVVSGCRARGFKNSAFGLYMNHGNWSNTTHPGHAHLDDTHVTDFGGQYGGLFASDNDLMPESTLALSGVALVQNPRAISGGSQYRAPMRDNAQHRVNIRCSECFGQDDTNAGWKICTTPNAEIGHIVNLDGVTAEGNFMPLWIQQNATQGIGRSVAINAVADGIVLIADYTSHRLCESFATGVTLRNVLGIVPSSPRFHSDALADFEMNDEEALSPVVTYTSRRLQGAVGFRISGTPPARTLAARCAVYNSTFVTDRSPADNGGDYPDPTILFEATLATTVNDNNILDGPWPENAGNPEPYGKLSTETLWSPRCIGFKGYRSKTMLIAFATPSGAVVRAAPPIGSPALGAAVSGETAHFDIAGKVRPVYPSVGAWEVS